MDWNDLSLAAAGVIGGLTALIHGILTQRLMVRPIAALAAGQNTLSAPILLHFSTFAWAIGGLALVAAARWSDGETRLAIALAVGALYLFGALGNAWATRGRHPGWMLMAAALALIAASLWPAGGAGV